MFSLLTADKEFAAHNTAVIDRWLSAWTPACITAARELQPLWSQPDAKPPRFEDGLDRAKNRFSQILSDLSLQTPKELTQ
jgi:propane monooxygenase small subunit